MGADLALASMAPESDVHTIGTRVWVRDDAESWNKGEVLKLDDGNLVINVEGGKQVKCKPEEAPIQNPDTRGGVEVSISTSARILASSCCAGYRRSIACVVPCKFEPHAIAICAGHDTAALLARARRALEPAEPLHV